MNRDELLSLLEKEHGGFVDLVKDLIPDDIDWVNFYSSGRRSPNTDTQPLEDSAHQFALLTQSTLVIVKVELEAFETVSTEFAIELRRSGKRLRHEVIPLTNIEKVILDSSSGKYLGRGSEPPDEFRLKIDLIDSGSISLPFLDENDVTDVSAKRARSEQVARFGLSLSRVLAKKLREP